MVLALCDIAFNRREMSGSGQWLAVRFPGGEGEFELLGGFRWFALFFAEADTHAEEPDGLAAAAKGFLEEIAVDFKGRFIAEALFGGAAEVGELELDEGFCDVAIGGLGGEVLLEFAELLLKLAFALIEVFEVAGEGALVAE